MSNEMKKKTIIDSVLLEFMPNALHLGLNCWHCRNQTTKE